MCLTVRPMPSYEVYKLRLDMTTKAKLETHARARNTSVANLLRTIVTDWLDGARASEYGVDARRQIPNKALRGAGTIRGDDPARAQQTSGRARDRKRSRRATVSGATAGRSGVVHGGGKPESIRQRTLRDLPRRRPKRDGEKPAACVDAEASGPETWTRKVHSARWWNMPRQGIQELSSCSARDSTSVTVWLRTIGRLRSGYVVPSAMDTRLPPPCSKSLRALESAADSPEASFPRTGWPGEQGAPTNRFQQYRGCMRAHVSVSNVEDRFRQTIMEPHAAAAPICFDDWVLRTHPRHSVVATSRIRPPALSSRIE